MSKKLFKRSLSLFLAILMLCSTLSLCISAVGISKVGDAELLSDTGNSLDLSTYCIVRPDVASHDIVYAAAALREYIKQYTGVNIKVKSDAEAETANEILIGKTNRGGEVAELYNTVSNTNWIVKQVDTKVVLFAGEKCDIANATNWFVQNCLKKNSNIMTIVEGYANSVVGFKIGSYPVSDLKVTYILGDNVGFIDAAILLADNIRRITGITPTVAEFDSSASGQILVASYTKGGEYAGIIPTDMQYVVEQCGNNIVIISNEEVGAEIGTQKIITAITKIKGEILDLASSDIVNNSSAYSYTFGESLNIEYGAEYRIMSYNVERVDSKLADNTSDRYDEAYNSVMGYNPDVIGFQEFCVNYRANLRPEIEAKGYTFVAPTPELYSERDNTCSGNQVSNSGGSYDINNNYTPIAYKTNKFNLLASGSKRIIPCRPNGDYDSLLDKIMGRNQYSNTIQGTYGWPGYTVTWAVLEDKTTGDVFAVSSLHNKTGSTEDDQTYKTASLAMVKDIVDTKITAVYNCPVFMVGDYNSTQSMADYKSFVTAENGIYDSRYVSEFGYSSCTSHRGRWTSHNQSTITASGNTSNVIDHIFVKGNAKVLRHRFGMTPDTCYSSDHSPTFVDVVVGEAPATPPTNTIYTGHGSSFHVNTVSSDYVAVENVLGDIFSDNGPLAITEVSPYVTETGYDFIEILNVSNNPVDLSDYNIHRDTRSHGGTWGLTVVNSILYQNNTLPTASTRHPLASSEMILDSGEVAIIWFNTQNKTDFASKRKVPSGTKISEVKIDSSSLITTMYRETDYTAAKQAQAKGDYLSYGYAVAYTLTIVNKDLSNGIGDYVNNEKTVAFTSNINTENQLFLRRNASSIVVMYQNDKTDLTAPCSAVFTDFYTEKELQSAIDNMSTAATKNTLASDFVGPLEAIKTSEAFAGIYNSNATATITPAPNLVFDTNPTPGKLTAEQYVFLKQGPLAITEMHIKSGTVATANQYEGYSYIEILNTSDIDIDLSKYYLYMIGFDNKTGVYYASSAEQLLGLADSQDVLAIKLNGTVKAHDIVVVMLNDKYDETAFITYWNGLGANLTEEDVIDIDVSTVNASLIHSSTYDTAYKNFLPRNTYATFSLALIPASEAIDVDGNAVTGETYAFNGNASTKKPTRQILENADCIVLYSPIYEVSKHSNFVQGSSAHFSAFIEKTSYDASVDATVYPDVVTTKKIYYYDDLYPSIAVTDPNAPCEALMDLTTAFAYTAGGKKAVAMPKVRTDRTPTPGKLDGVQYGHVEGDDCLAITEVAPNPTNGANFEYIEILNTSSYTVNLKDYYIYRYIFSHSGAFGYTGFGRVMGTYGNDMFDSNGNSGTTRVSLSALTGKTTLKATDGPLLIWLKSDDTEVTDFVKYWNDTTGSSITDANVAVIDVANYSVYNANSTAGYFGNGFLPDTKAIYAVSLIPDSFADNDTLDAVDSTKGMDLNEPHASTAARHNAADAMTVIFATGNAPGKVANRYGYFDAKAFDAAVENAKVLEQPSVVVGSANKYPSLMMPRPNTDGSVDLTLIKNTSFAYNMSDNNEKENSVYFLDVTAWEEPSPAALITGQFGNGTIAPTSDIKGTGLAMTEICVGTEAYKPDGVALTDNEFVEIKNTTNSPITLTDYRVILMGETNSGKYDGSMVFAGMWSDNAEATTGGCIRATEKSWAEISSVWKINTADTSGANVTELTGEAAKLAASDTAVIWFNNDLSTTSVSAFAKFWEERGNDMDGVIVAVATYTTGTSFENRGIGFLPECAVGFSLSVVNKTKTGFDAAYANLKQTSAAMTDTYVQWFINNADSITQIITNGGAQRNVSCNYFGYIDKAKYMQDAQEFSQCILAINGTTVPTVSGRTDGIVDAPYGTVVMKGQPVYPYINTSIGYGSTYFTGSNSASKYNAVFVKTAFDSVPTPGALLDGQFGYEADAELISVVGFQTGTTSYNVYENDGTTVAYKATDIRIMGNLNITHDQLNNYNVVGIEIAAAEKASISSRVEQYRTNSTQYDKCADSVCTKQILMTTPKVYQKLTDEAKNEYINENGYMFAINLSGIPVNNCNLTFRVFVENAQGEKICTGMYQITDTSI